MAQLCHPRAARASRLIDAFARDVLRRQLEHQHTRAGMLDLVVEIRLVLRELLTEQPREMQRLLLVLEHAHAPEDNDTAECQRPLHAILMAPLTRDAVRHLVARADRIELMARQCTVEIELAALLIIVMIERYAIRIPIIPKHRKHPALLPLHDRHAFLRRKLLLKSSHLAKHGHLPFSHRSHHLTTLAYHISAPSPIPSGFHVQSMLHMHSSRVNASTMLMIR